MTILYRARAREYLGFDFEYEHALREGVKFRWERCRGALKHRGGIALTCVKMARDAAGTVMPVEGSEFTIECDVVIPAIGQSPLLELLSQARGVAMERARGDRSRYGADHQS